MPLLSIIGSSKRRNNMSKSRQGGSYEGKRGHGKGFKRCPVELGEELEVEITQGYRRWRCWTRPASGGRLADPCSAPRCPTNGSACQPWQEQAEFQGQVARNEWRSGNCAPRTRRPREDLGAAGLAVQADLDCGAAAERLVRGCCGPGKAMGRAALKEWRQFFPGSVRR